MSQNRWKLCSTLSLLALASVLLPTAGAQCRPTLPSSVRPMAWEAPASRPVLHPSSYVQDEDKAKTPSIVGMWHVLFVAKTMNGAPIPNTTIDSSLVVWHADGTEIMNSGRPAQDGNFCMGVWEQTDSLSYRLNHFAWAANSYAPGTPDGVVGSPIGPVHYQENILLGPAGKHYSGVFTLDQYDTAGHVAASFTGVLKATRITVDTTVGDLL